MAQWKAQVHVERSDRLLELIVAYRVRAGIALAMNARAGVHDKTADDALRDASEAWEHVQNEVKEQQQGEF